MPNSILDFDPGAYFGNEQEEQGKMLSGLEICDFKKKKCCKKFKKGKKACKNCPKH